MKYPPHSLWTYLSGCEDLTKEGLLNAIRITIDHILEPKFEQLQYLTTSLDCSEELECFEEFVQKRTDKFFKTLPCTFKANLAVDIDDAIDAFNCNKDCYWEWQEVEPYGENARAYRRAFRRNIHEIIDFVKSFVHDAIIPEFNQVVSRLSNQLKKKEVSTKNYVHVTGIGQFLKTANERKLFMIWCIANMIESRRKDDKGVHHNFVTLEELTSEVMARLKCSRKTALKKINLITINDDPKLFIPFFRASNSGKLLFFVSQEKWIKFLLDKHEIKEPMKFHRQIRPASELRTYKEFTWAMVRAVAENPVPRPKKMTKGFFNKKERPNEVITGRGIRIISELSGFSEAHCLNLLSEHDRQMRRQGQYTIQRRYTTLKVVETMKEAEEFIQENSHLGHLWIEPSAFSKFGRQPIKLKLSNAYQFTGTAFAKRSLKLKPRKMQSDVDETMNGKVAKEPTTLNLASSIVFMPRQKFELRSTSTHSCNTMIVEKASPTFHHVDPLYSNNPELIVMRLKKLNSQMSQHCEFLLRHFGVDTSSIVVDLANQRLHQFKKMTDHQLKGSKFVDPHDVDELSKSRLRFERSKSRICSEGRYASTSQNTRPSASCGDFNSVSFKKMMKQNLNERRQQLLRLNCQN